MEKIKPLLIDAAFYVLGCFIYSVAVCVFISPNKITPGGITGVATVINYLLGVPSGVTVFALNIPIIILGYIKLGGRLIIKSGIAAAILSFSLDICEMLLPPFLSDKILAALFGGILMGVGLSIVLLRGATTGGVDIIAKVVNKKYRHITVGRVILILDAVTVVLSMAVYRSIVSGLYSAVALYVSTTVMDTILYGADKGKIIFIISEKSEEICRKINGAAHRGVTRLAVTGGYTGKQKEMLMCTVRVSEVSTVLHIINGCDSAAFTVISDAGEIIGEGFKNSDAD